MTRYKVEHIALDMTFYHPESSKLCPADEIVEAFETHKEHAEIFIQTQTGTAFSQVEMLNWFLLQTRTSIADHLPTERDNDNTPVFVTFPINFKVGTFHLFTKNGAEDLSHLKLMCKITFIEPNG